MCVCAHKITDADTILFVNPIALFCYARDLYIVLNVFVVKKSLFIAQITVTQL